jgi:hypothetical protein
MGMYSVKPWLSELSSSEVEIVMVTLYRYKSPGSDEILAEGVQAGGKILCSENCLSSGRGLLLYLFTRRAWKLTVVIIKAYCCYQLHIQFYPISSSEV